MANNDLQNITKKTKHKATPECHEINEIILKVELNTITLPSPPSVYMVI
jgi:hypothetical protein